MWVRSGYSVCHGLHVVQAYTFAVKAQWLVYVDQVLTLKNSAFCCHIVFVYSVWISEHTAIISLYVINWLVLITEKEYVYSAVRAESVSTL